MFLNTKRNVALVDVDGVIVANPSESLGQNTITDTNYWANHWNKPDEAGLQQEVIDLVQSLVSTGWQVIFLTARPEQFRKVTERLLHRAGLFVRPKDVRSILDQGMSNAPILIMWPELHVGLSSAAWKQRTIKSLKDQGLKIRFMIEDYRPNAEAIRSQTPVFLYERQKVSQYIDSLCIRCGGLSACWCHDDQSSDVAGL